MLTAKHARIMSKSVLMALAIKASSMLKASFIVGSYTAFFSAVAISAPLAGALAGIPGVLITALVGLFLRSTSILGANVLAYFVPGWFASLYWASRSSYIRLWTPLICMALFVAHPVGRQAYCYSWYWFIPVALYYYRNQTVFGVSLASTFVAHGVGSVIWLYTMPTNAAFWIALMPVVAFERLVFAMGMTLCYQLATQTKQYMRVLGSAIRNRGVVGRWCL